MSMLEKQVSLGALNSLVFRSMPSIGDPEESLVIVPERMVGEEEVMDIIRSFQPVGAPPLSREDVYFHSGIAATSALIPNRYMRLGFSTLVNIAKDINNGVAYMLSHNHAGIPIGRTFSGSCKRKRMEGGEPIYVVEYSAYFVKGVYNGEMSSDDHARLVQSGIIFDNSVGIYGGEVVCEVCESDYFGDTCKHIAGSSVEMSEAECDMQRKRGVKDGACTVRIENAHCTEISSVFDGAVEGAGIQAVFSSNRPKEEKNMSLQKLVETIFGKRPVIVLGAEEEAPSSSVSSLSSFNAATDEEEKLLDKIRLEKEAAEQELNRLKEERFKKERDFIYASVQREGYLTPAEYEQIKDFLLSLDLGQAESFCRFLRSRGAVVNMSSGSGSVNGEALRTEFEMKTGQERLHSLVLSRCKEKNIDYRLALAEVLKENPELADYREE